MTRRAFWPLMGTGAGWPRRAQPARKGGRSSNSVSSWTKSTVRAGKARIWRRIQRFFLSLRVRVQHVTEAFPDVAALVQAPSKRVLGEGGLVGSTLGQHLLQERDGPTGGPVAKVARAAGQHRRQEFLQLFIPTQGTALASLMAEPVQVGVGAVTFNPAIDAARRDAQLAGHLLQASTGIEFQQREDASKQGRVAGERQFAFQAPALSCG